MSRFLIKDPTQLEEGRGNTKRKERRGCGKKQSAVLRWFAITVVQVDNLKHVARSCKSRGFAQ